MADDEPSEPDRPLEEWVAALRHVDPVLRTRAAKALSKVGPPALPALPMLVATLADPDPMVRSMAAAAIGRLGPPAAAAAEDLARLLEDEAFPARFWAADSLGRLGPSARAALPGLERAADDPNKAVRGAVRLALRLVRGDATEPGPGRSQG
jgi:HEAT repeat protein